MLNESITIIYENYIEDVDKAMSEDAKHLGGLSRMISGKQSKADEMLPAFDSGLEEAINSLLVETSESAEVRELMDYMLLKVSEYADAPKLKFSFLAVHRHLLPFVSCLNSEDASYLYKKFEDAIPRQERFPVQNKLMKKLKEQSRK